MPLQDVVAGDGTTSVTVMCGALLKKSLELLERGVHPTVISDAFGKAADKAVEVRGGSGGGSGQLAAAARSPQLAAGGGAWLPPSELHAALPKATRLSMPTRRPLPCPPPAPLPADPD